MESIPRIPSVTTLCNRLSQSLTVTDLRRILTEVKGPLVSQYATLFAYSCIEIKFTNDALCAICRKAVKRGGGARGLEDLVDTPSNPPLGSNVRSTVSFS